MSATEVHSPTSDAVAGTVDMHLEVDIIPVSDVDRAKEFYQRLGWRLDADDAPLDGLRIVQFTPPGSAASVTFGLGLTSAAPGSVPRARSPSAHPAPRTRCAGRAAALLKREWTSPPTEPRNGAPRWQPPRPRTLIPGTGRPRGSAPGTLPGATGRR